MYLRKKELESVLARSATIRDVIKVANHLYLLDITALKLSQDFQILQIL